MSSLLTHGDKGSWTEVLWAALHAYRETCLPEGYAEYDVEWDEICTVMAWVSEEIGVEEAAQ
jgi:hypothetical protein